MNTPKDGSLDVCLNCGAQIHYRGKAWHHTHGDNSQVVDVYCTDDVGDGDFTRAEPGGL